MKSTVRKALYRISSKEGPVRLDAYLDLLSEVSATEEETLREAVIRLAYENREFRPQLLALLEEED